MTYEEALKQVQGKTPAINKSFLKIKFGYQIEVILPFKQGVALIESLQHGWFYTANYSSPPDFRAIESKDFEAAVCSEEEVQRIQMAKLLGISIHDLDKVKDEQTKQPLSAVA